MSAVEAEKQEILNGIAAIIRDLIGEEWVTDTPIVRETTLATDLELESIELVALAERIQERYGETLDFAGWLADMELDELIALDVGQLVDFIAACR